MIESVWSKSVGGFAIGKGNVVFDEFGKVIQITHIYPRNDNSFFRIIFNEKILDIYDFILVIRNIIEVE